MTIIIFKSNYKSNDSNVLQIDGCNAYRNVIYIQIIYQQAVCTCNSYRICNTNTVHRNTLSTYV